MPHSSSAARFPLDTTSARPSRLRVLVVDNEPSIGSLIERLLRRDHEVIVCETVDAACDIVRRGSTFDVILCDLLMPDGGGAAFHASIVRTAPDLADKIVFITGAACLGSTQSFLRSVSNVALSKPFTSYELLDTVRRVAGRDPAPFRH